MYSRAHPTAPTTTTTTYRTLAPRSAAAIKPSTLLSDIAEHTHNVEQTRAPSPPPRPSLRSVSVTSFLSDGTMEIEGFGFDNISEYGDDDNISTYGADSLYEGSVYDGEEGEHREVDLSRRAESILASAKRRLDLCGRNISRARSSLILSPSATPTALMDHLDAVGPVTRRRAESAGGSRSLQWKYNNRAETEDRGMAHTRTASESAVHSARVLGAGGRSGGMMSGSIDMGVLVEDPRESAEKQQVRGVIRSNSTQQMRALRDQMKDLRGKITSLQEQTKSDSLRRRQSISSMRSTPTPSDNTPQYSPTGPTLEDIRESRVLNLKSPIEQEWEHIAAQKRESTDTASVYSDRSGTPTAPRLDDANLSSSARYDSSYAFSYDSYLFGEAFIKGIRPTSMSSDGTASTATATLPAPHTVQRKGSFVSISSYATADEDPNTSPPRSPGQSPDNHQKAGASLLLPGLRPPSMLPASPRNWAVPNGSLRVDDGYHSAPHTPRVEKDLQPTVATRPPIMPASSWYRDSMDSVRTRSMVFEGLAEEGMGRGGGVAISSSARDSHTMTVGGMGGEGDIELKIDKGDRALIEGVIEALGKVCYSMEMEGDVSRAELRERLRGALKVLEGEDPEGEMF
ncbi:hypothetical protein K440DRAFT_660337 [Wilcoxina mikolae CBS 423.85]|nr:hypothetical protein K440DRAFT_660337 [Wilcoxina mikolae CBS 423.85]